MTDLAGAWADIATVLNTAWNAGGATTGLQLLWPGVDGDPPKTAVSWGRVIVAHTFGGAATLGSQLGSRRFNRGGVLTVELYAPYGNGPAVPYAMADVVLAAFEGAATPNGVSFSAQSPVDIGAVGNFYQVNVATNFSYQQIR